MTEAELCKQITAWMSAQQPDCLFFHVPNGEHRNAITGAKLKAMGVKAGVPDYVLVMPDGRCGFVECKVGKGKLNDNQIAFTARLDGLGHVYAVCRSLDEWIALLRAWGVVWRGMK